MLRPGWTWSPGDWWCSQCQGVNYAYRRECRMCPSKGFQASYIEDERRKMHESRFRYWQEDHDSMRERDEAQRRRKNSAVFQQIREQRASQEPDEVVNYEGNVQHGGSSSSAGAMRSTE